MLEQEWRLLAESFLMGVKLAAVYDIFRIIRRIISHNVFFRDVEDAFFWIGALFWLFSFQLRMTEGMLRLYVMICICTAMIGYHLIISPIVIKPVDKAVSKIKTLLTKRKKMIKITSKKRRIEEKETGDNYGKKKNKS